MSLLDTASLVITPNGYKEGKLYSVVPSDGSGDLNVTRATTATRVNEAGLVELVPYNLLQYSEQFDNAYWSYYQATITANTTVAPNGTTTADRINQFSGTGGNVVVSSANVNTGNITLSSYLKLGNGGNGVLALNDGSWKNGYFNLTSGTVVAVDSGVTATITDTGNGWWRCTISIVSSANSVTINVGHILNSSQYGYIWGAQLVEGSTAKDYQKTETRLNIPRLDYSNGTCPSILVEPQRTNLVTYSEQFDNASWNKVNDITVDSNASVAPDGNTTADRLNAITTVSVLRQLINVTAGQTYTFSGYIKKSSGSPTTKIRIEEQTAPYNNTNIDVVSTGTWQKFSVTRTIASGITQVSIDIFPDINSNGSVFIWGAQLEAGSYATSYIPTTSSSVTRNADVVSKTGISSLIGQTEGTVFLDYIWNSPSSDVIPIAINGNGGKFMWFRQNGVQFYGNGSSLLFSNNNVSAYGNRYKIAFVYGQNDFRIYINGSLSGVSTSGTFTGTFDDLVFTPIGSPTFNDSMKHNTIALWKTRLTNTQLASLTTI